MDLFQKKKQPELDMEAAQKMLENVFDACNYDHNSVPIEVLSSYSNYRRERYGMQKRIIIGMMVVFLLLPLLFIAPDVTIAQESDSRFRVKVSTFLPVRYIYAEMDGENLPVYEVNSHEYIIQPDNNGELTVTASLLNGQKTSVGYEISGVDADNPVLQASDADDDNHLLLYVQDESSGVDESKIRITGQNGVSITDFTYDSETGCLSLPYPEQQMNVYIPDKAGNTLHILLTP